MPIWGGRNAKGYLLRQNLEAVFDWAVGSNYRVDNPAAALKRLLPRVKAVVNHRSSLMAEGLARVEGTQVRALGVAR